MEYKTIFPTTIGIKNLEYIPDSYVNQCIEYIKQQPMDISLNPSTKSDNLTHNQQILNIPHFLPLKKEIIKYALLYSKKLGIPLQNLQISNSWGYVINKNNKTDNFHVHANSLLSGVVYLTSGSPIVFRSNFFKDLHFKTSPKTQNQSNLHQSVFPINKKQIILFPSHLPHSVEKHSSSEERISIAFNLIPKGEFGAPHERLYL